VASIRSDVLEIAYTESGVASGHERRHGLAGVGHFPQREAPGEVTALVREHLGRAERESRGR
jgi:pimeloyl-ACP methyl ester carboxylesterase